MRGRLATAELRGILDVVEHQGSSMQKIDNLPDDSRIGWRYFEPDVQCVDDLVTDTLGRQRVEIL